MRRAVFSLIGLLGLTSLPLWSVAAGAQDYAILVISRERLEVATPCEIGISIQDQLVGRLFQEDSASFNLPAGQYTVRLNTLPGQAPGCQPGLGAPNGTLLKLQNGDIKKYRIATGANGLFLTPAALNYGDQ
ncbi:hypothetical protein [Pseudomonas sp. nanlin1]|uniref:hypothetical protein n=1 Tax=Pseudomonas sp. nanlin1 TaxID=3040605 RepID=UPI00388EA3F2